MIQAKERILQIGQTMHGYEGGHSLLASSEILSHSTESALFMLSDLSGDHIVPGFEEYITGYPLPDMASYALAKTWYAPEMERPGCVWTHTLLIRGSDLAAIEDLALLVQRFVRPHREKEGWSAYEKKLIVDLGDDQYFSPERPSNTKHDSEVLSALYSQSEAPIFLTAKSVSEYEDLVFKLWSQQWPRLRRRFRFCTGSLEGRSFDGRPFDLQVIPFASSSVVAREFPKALFVGEDSEEMVNAEEKPSWLDLALTDLRFPNRKLREFLRRYGADVSPKRNSFARLLRAFDLIQNVRRKELPFSDLLENMLSIFPSGAEAAKLKLSVLLPSPTDSPGLELPFSNQQRLYDLATLANDSGLPKKLGNIDDWIRDLLQDEELETFKFVQSLADSPHVNSVGQQLLSSIAVNIRPEQLRSADLTPSVSLLLVTRNPRLATEPTMWQILAPRSHELLDLLKSCNLTQQDWSRITQAALDSLVPNVADAFLRIVGSQAIRTALDRANEHGNLQDTGQDWREVFGNQSATVAEWLKHVGRPLGRVLEDLTSDLNPADPAILSLGSDIWCPVADRTRSLSTRSNVFLFVLGCQNPSGAPFELVSQVFERVHRAAGYDSLGYQSWQLLRDVLPVLGWPQDWDVCERLRRLLVSRFVIFDWPIQAFLRALENPETFDRTLQFIRTQKDLRSFGRRLADHIQTGEALLTSEQSTVFGLYRKKLIRS